MTWNHRVVKRTYTTSAGTEVAFGIYEVYYDADGKPMACTVEPVEPMGETLEDLALEMELFAAALQKPVLDFDTDFPTSEKEMMMSGLAELIESDGLGDEW